MASTADTSSRARGYALQWRALAALYLAGAVIGSVSLLLPHDRDANAFGLWSNIVLAVVAGATFFALPDRLPLWLNHVMLLCGTLVVGRAVYYSGDPQTYYAIWWVWIALYVFSFYERRVAAAHVAFIGITYAALLVEMSPPSAEARWLTTIATVVIAAVFVDKLVRVLRSHAREAEINRERLEAAMVQLEAAARTDGLTGLLNRRSWDEELHRAVAHARRFDMPVCIGVLDLDDFKKLNDTLGHSAGDELLRDAACAWLSQLRDVDTLARWGGDEFAVIIPGCDADAAADALERVRRATPVPSTCSAGLVRWNGEESEARLMARADEALYAAKRTGRNRLVASSGATAASR